jgi:hypothetical protein
VTEALQQEIRTLRSLFHSERDPDGRVFAPLADAHRRAGELQEAVRLLNDGLTRLPDFVPGHVVAAQLYVEQGLTEEAAFAARRALELDGENVNALESMLRVLEEQGDASAASEIRGQLASLQSDFVPEGAGEATSEWDESTSYGLDGPEEVDGAGGAPTVVEPALGDVAQDADTVELRALPPEPRHSGLQDTIAMGALAGLDLTVDEAAPAAPDEPTPEPGRTLPLDALAPGMESAIEEPVFDLDALAPSPEDEAMAADIMDLGSLSPDEPAGEDVVPFQSVATNMGSAMEEQVFDLDALAPSPEDEAMAADIMDLGSLAPDAPVNQDVVSFDALAPDTEPAIEEPVFDMEALAPSPWPQAVDEVVMDLGALAPDAPAEEEVVSLDALAPDTDSSTDEPVFDMDALAPSPEAQAIDEVVMDLSALAPDVGADDEVVSLDSLAPSAEPAAEEPVWDMDDLAPSAEPSTLEPVWEMDALAPTSEDEVVMELDALAPDVSVDEEVVSLESLAPSVEPALAEQVFDMDELAPMSKKVAAEVAPDMDARSPFPEPRETEDIVIDLDTLAPEPIVDESPMDLDALAPAVESSNVGAVFDLDMVAGGPLVDALPEDPGEESGVEEEAPPTPEPVDDEPGEPAQRATEEEAKVAARDDEPGEPIYTRTLASLYETQGAITEALTVLRRLSAADPEDTELRGRIVELEGRLAGMEGAGGMVTPLGGNDEEEVETLARDLAESGEGRHEVDSPFSWVRHEAEEKSPSGPSVREYFDDLLAWEPREES